MVDICDDIEEAKQCLGQMAHDYAVAATYGNETEEMLFNLAKMCAMVNTLERNVTEYKKVKVTADNAVGKYVSFSSLTKRNNVLFLDIADSTICASVEIEPCLSDSEICRIVEQTKTLCYYCQ